MRYRLLLAAGLCLSLSGSAAAHTSVGGGSSGPEDPNADCLRWEVVPLTVDSGVADGAAADAGRSDAGSAGVTVLRCAEHATMFGCACTLGRTPNAGDRSTAALATAAFAALMMRARRARRTHRRGAGR